MVQDRDFPGALASLKSIERAAGRIPRLILWNDDSGSPHRLSLDSLGATVIDAGKNLGVAAGRNLLFQTAVEMGVEWIVVVDDDLLVPGDYLARAMRLAHRIQRTDERLGIVAPSVLGFPALAEQIPTRTQPADWRTDLRSTARLRRFLRTSLGEDVPAALVDYMGIRSWERHYMSAHGRSSALLREFLEGSAHDPSAVNGAVRSDSQARRSILAPNHPIPVDTVPGGVSILSATMLKDIGLLDESMGAFGYEDAEFCVRARRRGYSVYTAPSLIVLHDIQSRGRSRDLASIYSSRSRHRALLLDKHVAGEDSGWLLLELFCMGVPEASDAVVRKLGERDQDEAARLYLKMIAAFLVQWHSLTQTGLTERISEEWFGVTSLGRWRVLRERGPDMTELRVELEGSDEARVKNASIRASTHGPRHAASELNWTIVFRTHAGSVVELDVHTYRDNESASWQLEALGGQWDLSVADLAMWEKLMEEHGPKNWMAELSRAKEGQFSLVPGRSGDLGEFRLDWLS